MALFVDGFVHGAGGAGGGGESTRRLLRESGIAFNVYADPTTGRMRGGWTWCRCCCRTRSGHARGRILQRARLIDAVLADLHGTQRLLQDGSLPASLLLGSPAFVRTSVDREAPERRFLYAYACDVARTPPASG